MKLGKVLKGFLEGVGFGIIGLTLFGLVIGGFYQLFIVGLLEGEWIPILRGCVMLIVACGMIGVYDVLEKKPGVHCDRCKTDITHKDSHHIISGEKKWDFCKECFPKIKTIK